MARAKEKAKRIFTIGMLCLAATFINPYGLSYSWISFGLIFDKESCKLLK